MKNRIKAVLTRRWSDHLIELLIVIIGISIAFWLNNVASESKDNKVKLTYLADIKSDLIKDSIRLSSNIRNNEAKNEKLHHSLKLIQQNAPVDSVLAYVIQIGQYDFFRTESFTLSSLLQSGDLKLIDSEETKRELLRLLKLYEEIDNMQKNFLQALDQNYFPMLLSKVDMIEFKAIDPDYFYGVEIKNYNVFTINETDQHIRMYKYARQQASRVLEVIENELAE